MRPLTRLLSFWLFSAFLVLWLLQLFPTSGIIVMMFGAAFWCGILLLASVIVLFIEALIGRVPRWMVIIPIILFGGYYALYFQQAFQIANREAELQQANKKDLYRFNHDQENLVTKHARVLVSGYRVPVVYEPNKNFVEGHLSHRIITSESCGSIPKDSESRIQKSGVNYRTPPRHGRTYGSLRSRVGLCMLRMPEKPTKQLITVDVKDQQIWKKKASIEEGVYTLKKGGKIIGQYRTASVQKYTKLPFPIIGCFLNSSAPSWDCVYRLRKSLYWLKTNPVGTSQDIKVNPVAMMLGLKEYQDEDYSNFKEYPESASAITKAQGAAENLIDGMFEQLDSMMVSPDQKVSWRMEQTLTRDPSRIAERAEQIVNYLGELENDSSNKINNVYSKQRLMFSMLAWLPEDTLKAYGPKIFARLVNYKELDNAPELYIRLGDTADSVSNLGSYYEDHLLTGRIGGWQNYLPASALCRVGKASASTIEFMKKEFKKQDNKKNNNRYHQALFLALLKMGEREFIQRILPDQKMRHSKWYNKVLNGAGNGPYGPNNCVVKDGEAGNLAPVSMQRVVKK